MKSLIKVLKEQIDSFYLITRLSLYEAKSTNSNNYLGVFWEVLNPMIQIGIYWFVFGYGLSTRDNVDDVPYLPWMLSGIVVWFFIQPGVLLASKSIYTRIKTIARMSFPMSAIPSFVIISKIYFHLILLGIIMIILQFYGFFVSVYYIQLPYMLICTLFLLLALGLITSTLATIVRDVQMIVQAVMRMLLYLSAILWPPEMIDNPVVIMIMKINPFYYIVEGYRASLLGTSWYFIEEIQYTIYFWVLVSVLLLIGSSIHVKFRNRFIDFL
ncbi:ABC transporter permease [Bacillus spongiae]|uniref:Transport permease protein n=1 Tax=Bacillus spongiae TaxID=2683610 RepID=A0ABU8HE86_9BACI